ncbi:MAG TPA: isoprenylcysteine carboxylmethyltransferase family protein [Solirubrobacterales bacterium]|nr:isoprenylcysteine carboxylmethyltransferase family protein [Solirubrobacterales bacterium]
MQPLPYDNSGARVVFYVLVVLWVAGELRARIRSRGNQRDASEEWGSLVAVVVGIYVGVIGAFLAASKVESAAIDFARLPIFVAGALLTAVGISFRQWAIAVLGAWFTIDVRVGVDQPVVESGPYRWVAHPSYTGMEMVFVGLGLMLGNWLSLAFLVFVPLVGLLVRIRVEERAMLAGLGEPYRRFLAGRARLVPGIW